MADTTSNQGKVVQEQTGPELLVRQVRDALASLYDLPYLQSHPLARLLPRPSSSGPAALGQMLQHRLLDGIERLQPVSEGNAVEEAASLRYDIVRFRYVDGIDIPSVCRRLGCSRAAYFRQLNLGLQTIVANLRAQVVSGSGPLPHLMSVGYQTPLVGREQELELLKAAYAATASGDGGRVVMISGDQGVGKTRLAQELGDYVGQEGGLFLEGRWAAWEGAAPYGALAECLRRHLRLLAPEDVALAVGPYARDLARLFPGVVDYTDSSNGDTALGVEEQQLRLYQGVCTVVQNLSQKQPLVLFMDDLHLAPQMRLQLHVARLVQECPLLIVYTYREDELLERPALVSGRNELIRSRLITDVRLAPLSEAETGRMIAYSFGDGPASQLQSSTYAINRGNPFFVEEMLRFLVENDAVRWIQDHWEVLDSTRVGIPESVKLLVQERVTRLGEDAVATLQQAAVLGEEFSFAALSHMAGRPEDQLVAILDQAMSAGLLVDRTVSPTEERYWFREDHIQEVLYQIIPAARRRRYHLQAGQALNALYPHRLEELAYHFTHGSDVTQAAFYSYQAAERAGSLFNWNRAIALYQDALDLWDELGEHLDERAAVAEKLGDACYKSGIQAQRAVGYLRQALGFYEDLGNPYKVAIIKSQLGREQMHGGNLAVQDLDLALENLLQAKAIFDREPEGIPHGMVYCGLALTHLDRLELSEAVSWARQAIQLGERLGSPAVVANAYGPLGLALSRTAIDQAREVLELGWQTSLRNKLGFQADLSRASGSRVLGVILKDPDTGLNWVGRGPDYQTTYSLFDIPAHLVALHTLKGDFDEAERILEDLQSVLRALGQPVFGLWPDELGLLWIRKGDLDHAEDQLWEAFEWAGSSNNRLVEAATAQKLGEVYLVSQQYFNAERYLVHALDMARESGSVVCELALLPHLCELYVRTGRTAEASEHLIQGQNILIGLGNCSALQGDMLLAQGMVSSARELWSDAEGAFKAAIEIYQEFGLPWDEARVLYEWAVALMGGQENGSQTGRSKDMMQKALSLWEPMGASLYAERCLALLGR